MTPRAAAGTDLTGVAVVVVNYGSSDLLARNLGAGDLAASGAGVVVVDNATTGEERERVRRLSAEHGWLLVEPDRNVGFGAGMNIGVEAARRAGHDTFLLLNPDASISADGVHRLVGEVRRDTSTLVSPVVVRPDGTAWFRGAWVDVPHGRTRQSAGLGPDPRNGWLAGTCLVVHADLWDRIGGFDEAYFLYWEDVDLSWRCTAAGGRLVVRTDVQAVHSVGGTQGPGKSSAYLYWNCRNRLLFAAVHLTRRDLGRWALRTPRYARDVLLRGGRRQLLRPVGPVSAVVRGSCAGLVLAARTLTTSPSAPSLHATGAPL